jgi:hypothetical protein
LTYGLFYDSFSLDKHCLGGQKMNGINKLIVSLPLVLTLSFLSACDAPTGGQLQPSEIGALQRAHDGGILLYGDNSGQRGYQNMAVVNNNGVYQDYRAWSYGGDKQPATDLRQNYNNNDWNWQRDNNYGSEWRDPNYHSDPSVPYQHNQPGYCQYKHKVHGQWVCW